MTNPRKEHWKVVKYIQNTMDVELCFTRKSAKLLGFSDKDFGGDPESSRSTSS